jgi:hypothetical protein
MPDTYRGRRAATVENDDLRVTVLEAGGHIAEIYDKRAGVNPLWSPPWPSIEPASYDPAAHPQYGAGAEAPLLAGIMGHNVCLDIFGGPSPQEEAQGLKVHGEASSVVYDIARDGAALIMRAMLPLAQIRFQRRLELRGRAARIQETVESLCAFDRPIAWTQHVTLGPPFLEKGVTEFRAPATRSMVFEPSFGTDDYLVAGATFDWPMAPRNGGGTIDLRFTHDMPMSSAYTAHLMDPGGARAFFIAFSRRWRLAFGYVWNRADFPWLGIWEENFSRTHAPWSGRTLARGMEFGVSPLPESRRQMIERSKLFDVPTYRWLPAKSTLETEYWVVAREAGQIPETLYFEG